jgi:hypothetical protein
MNGKYLPEPQPGPGPDDDGETGLAAARAMAIRLAAILRRGGQPQPDQPPADVSGPGPVSDHRQQLLQ